jgi:hypothetical protein
VDELPQKHGIMEVLVDGISAAHFKSVNQNKLKII